VPRRCPWRAFSRSPLRVQKDSETLVLRDDAVSAQHPQQLPVDRSERWHGLALAASGAREAIAIHGRLPGLTRAVEKKKALDAAGRISRVHERRRVESRARPSTPIVCAGARCANRGVADRIRPSGKPVRCGCVALWWSAPLMRGRNFAFISVNAHEHAHPTKKFRAPCPQPVRWEDSLDGLSRLCVLAIRVVEERSGWNSQTVGEALNGRQAGLAITALQSPDRGGMDPGAMRETRLG
jgi:hypothetical protein